MTEGLRSRSNETQLSECGHDRSCLDFGSDRDIKCRTCWENREILIQRLIEPFQHAFGSLGVDAVVNENGLGFAPSPTAPPPPPKAGTVGRARSLRRRAGSKRTRSESRNSTSREAGGERAGVENGYSLRSASRTVSDPEEEECIRVMDVGLTRSRSESNGKPVEKSPKSGWPTMPETKDSGVRWWEAGKGRETPGKHQQRSSSVSSAPPKSGIQPAKKSQPTLHSFFAPKQNLENGAGTATFPAPPDHLKNPEPSHSASNSNSPKKPAFGNATKLDPSSKAKERRPAEKVVRKPPRPGTRRSRRDSKKDAINYKEDSNSDVAIED